MASVLAGGPTFATSPTLRARTHTTTSATRADREGGPSRDGVVPQGDPNSPGSWDPSAQRQGPWYRWSSVLAKKRGWLAGNKARWANSLGGDLVGGVTW